MKIIPVIDYKQGDIVLAKMGNRSEYTPVNSKLCVSSNPYHVIDSILTLASFKTIYIADLDCIENQQLDRLFWPTLCQQFHHIEFWIDLGSICNEWPNFMHASKNARPIIGSESFKSMRDINSAINLLKGFNPLVSIDLKNNRILGPKNFSLQSLNHVNDLITLSIDHVGSELGLNLNAINHIRETYNLNTSMHYGGGIRNTKDIQKLDELSIDGVLVASALHNGNITKKELESFIS